MLALLSILGVLGSVFVYDQVTDDSNDNDNNDRVGPEPVKGTDQGDMLDLGDTGFSVNAGAGNDVVTTGAGNDAVDAGMGADLVETGRGDDTVNGNQGDDLVNAGPGDDRVDLGFGDDAYLGGVANNADIDLEDLFGDDDANEVFITAAGVDFPLQTDDPSTQADPTRLDVFLSRIPENISDDDVVDGGEGDDILVDIKGSDILNGDAGNDRIVSVDAGTASLANGDRVDGGDGDDVIVTDAGDIATGGAGADQFGLLSRSAGQDVQLITDFDPAEDAISVLVQHGLPEDMVVELVVSGSGDDTEVLVNGGVVAILQNVTPSQISADQVTAQHVDTLDPAPVTPEPEPISVDGTPGDDMFTLGDEGFDVTLDAGDDTVLTGDGDDKVAGGEGADVIETGRGSDTVNANQGADVVNAGPGDDVVTLGWGDDGYLGGVSNGADIDLTQVFNDDPNDEVFVKMKGLDAVLQSDTPSGLPDPAQIDVFLPGISDNVTDNDTVSGGEGNDTIIDIKGSDTLNGDNGDDRISSLDTREASLANADTVNGGDGNDVLITDAGDTVTGGAGADQFGMINRVLGEDVQVVTDFDPVEDALTVLVEHGLPEDVTLNLVTTSSGTDTGVEVNGMLQAILQGVTPDQLDAASIVAVHADA